MLERHNLLYIYINDVEVDDGDDDEEEDGGEVIVVRGLCGKAVVDCVYVPRRGAVS